MVTFVIIYWTYIVKGTATKFREIGPWRKKAQISNRDDFYTQKNTMVLGHKRQMNITMNMLTNSENSCDETWCTIKRYNCKSKHERSSSTQTWKINLKHLWNEIPQKVKVAIDTLELPAWPIPYISPLIKRNTLFLSNLTFELLLLCQIVLSLSTCLDFLFSDWLEFSVVSRMF